MIYVLLNLAVTAFLIFFIYRIDSRAKLENTDVNKFSIALLITTLEAIVVFLTILLKDAMLETFVNNFMKFAFVLEGISFVIIGFEFPAIEAKQRRRVVSLLKFVCYVLAIYIVFWKLNKISIMDDTGLVVESDFLFSSPAREFFPWSWYTLYSALFRYFIPIVGLVFLVVLQENHNATQLERYRTVYFAEGLLIMWGTRFLIRVVAVASPQFSLLFMYASLFMYVLFYRGFSRTSVPSGRGVFFSILDLLVSYLLPAAIVGFLITFVQPEGEFRTGGFIAELIFISAAGIVLSLKVSEWLFATVRVYAADYESSLEKGLASIDYAASEMDEVTAKMYDILKKNIEASSMTVYIQNGENALEVAYSSSGLTSKIPIGNNPMFDTLLNVNKTIVLHSEIEKEHDISSIKTELKTFFGITKSDAIFILNEGHNIFGVITLGKKISGDHYKEYDYNVFSKLYSYFFVFGYYMRNISNKDVISVVNREIKMSSQIITSIQENIDQIKNPKVDSGYLMIPSHNIGGEFIDMIRLTQSRHLFVVGDLSGKGIAASMSMVILKSIIRTFLAETHDFKQLVVKINEFIRDSLQKGTVFAGLFALIDFDTDTMYYINCGIPALMMYTQVYNNVIEIQGSGHILGFVKDISPYISVKTTKLNRGDIILACTDGLIQSHSLRGEQFGKERVQQALLDNSTYPAQRMTQFIFDGLLKFMSKEMEDDVSILVLKYETTREFADDEPETAAEPENTAGPESPAESGATDASESEASDEPDAPQAAEETVPADEPVTPPPEAEEKSVPAEDFGLPEGFDLGSIDEIMKQAGL